MQFCRDCNVKMVGVMSFSRERHEKFLRCYKCYSETRHRKLDDKELNFEEVLEREIHKRK